MVLFLLFFLSNAAFAQVNLDKPIFVGMADQIYEAVNEKNTYYFFPKELCRASVPEEKQVGVRLFNDFSVALCKVEIMKVRGQLQLYGIKDPNVRVLRGISSLVNAMSLNDAYPSFDPKIEVLGDSGNFAEMVPYRVSLYSGTKRRSIRRAREVMSALFGVNSFDAFVQIEFKFSSMLGGQLRESASAVAIYIGRGPMREHTKNPFGMYYGDKQFSGMQILENKITQCWGRPTPGVICLK